MNFIRSFIRSNRRRAAWYIHIQNTVRSWRVCESRAVLLANHGLVTCGVSLAKAFNLAVSCEFCAEMQWMCESTGQNRGVVLTDQEMADVMTRFQSYGQVKTPDKNNGGY